MLGGELQVTRQRSVGMLALARRLALLIGLLTASCGQGPPGVTATCAFDMQRIARIRGDYAGRAGLGLVTDDRILTVNNSDRSSIHVFDREGSYLRTIGGEGQGPGEFQAIGALRELPDGRIAVFDSRALHVSYYTPELIIQGTHRLPVSIWPHGAVWDPSGGWYLAGRMPNRDHFGSPAVRVTEDGSVLTYFGQNETEKEGHLAGMVVPRSIAFHPDHGLFTLKSNQYVLENWTIDGALARTVSLDVEWFQWPPPWIEDLPEETERGVNIADREPENAFLDIQFGADGHLWTLAQVTPLTWREGLSAGRVIDYAAWTDNVIHILDLTAGGDVCTVRIEDVYIFAGFAGRGILKSVEEDRVGQPTVTFWELTISQWGDQR